MWENKAINVNKLCSKFEIDISNNELKFWVRFENE